MSGVYFYFINKLVCCLGESISNLRAESSLHSLNFGVWRGTRLPFIRSQLRESQSTSERLVKMPQSLHNFLESKEGKVFLRGSPLCEPLVKEHVAEFHVFKCQSLALDTLTLNPADTFWRLRNICIFHWTKTSHSTSIHTWLEAWIYDLLSFMVP